MRERNLSVYILDEGIILLIFILKIIGELYPRMNSSICFLMIACVFLLIAVKYISIIPYSNKLIWQVIYNRLGLVLYLITVPVVNRNFLSPEHWTTPEINQIALSIILHLFYGYTFYILSKYVYYIIEQVAPFYRVMLNLHNDDGRKWTTPS